MGGMLNRKPSGATVVAFVALVAALSGSAVALPGTSSVDSGDIKNNSIRSRDLRNNDVRGRDIRNNTVTGADVRESTLGKVASASDADTAANAANLAGESAGDYLNDIHMVSQTSGNNSGSPKTIGANCGSGEEIVGGGADIAGGAAPENIVLQDSRPDQSDPGDAFDNWVARAVETEPDAGNWTLTVYALCADG